jgi:serine/threonine-protein kinase/endoribonuclease IRE1
MLYKLTPSPLFYHGYGSQGTVVYKGQFDGRQVAVKRLLLDFYDVALKEVKLLQESDDHPNVVRYFYKEEYDGFLYIALELCYGSLSSYIERTLPFQDVLEPAHILSQFISGLQYLHSLKIVHRDIKPHNILIAPSTTGMRILISDFGLCKKLDGEQSSFNYTAASPAGTTGWRAPELLAGVLAATPSDTSNHSDETTMVGRVKATRAIDIFSAGCVFYYVLTSGDHPFGNRFGRENNILNGNYDLQKLQHVDDSIEASDLVERMISSQPKQR